MSKKYWRGVKWIEGKRGIHVLIVMVILLWLVPNISLISQANAESGEVVTSDFEEIAAVESKENFEDFDYIEVYENSISGTLWIDSNDNGMMDDDEQILSNYPVSLYLESDKETSAQTVITDINGEYIFVNLEPESYVVGIKTKTIDEIEYSLPLAGDSSDNQFKVISDSIRAYTDVITIDKDTIIENMNAGIRGPVEIQERNIAEIEIDSLENLMKGDGWSFANGVLTFNDNAGGKSYTIIQSPLSEVTTNRIVVQQGVGTNITLSGVKINSSDSPFQLNKGANVNLILAKGTINELQSTNLSENKPSSGIYVPSGAKVTVGGEGTLTAIGGYGSAGIGGGPQGKEAGTIEIIGGNITAIGGKEASGIGGGNRENGGIINILGGVITAIGGENGSGIGGGANGSGASIVLNHNATVKAYATSLEHPAIHATSVSGDGYYVNAYLTSGAISDDTVTTLKVYHSGGEESYANLSLPAGYRSFGYITREAESTMDNIQVYDQNNRDLGSIVYTENGSPDIKSDTQTTKVQQVKLQEMYHVTVQHLNMDNEEIVRPTSVGIVSGGDFTVMPISKGGYSARYFIVGDDNTKYDSFGKEITITENKNIVIYYANTNINITIPTDVWDFYVNDVTYPSVNSDNHYIFTNESDLPVEVSFEAIMIDDAASLTFVEDGQSNQAPNHISINLELPDDNSLNNGFFRGVDGLTETTPATNLGVLDGTHFSQTTPTSQTGYLTIGGHYNRGNLPIEKFPALQMKFSYSLVNS